MSSPTAADAERYAGQLNITTCLEADGLIGLSPTDVTWLVEHAAGELRSYRWIGGALLSDIYLHGHQSTFGMVQP